MADLGNFDANQVDPAQDFDALPAGRYEVMIVESERVENSSGNGSHLKLTFQVIEGQYKGKPLWHRLNLENPSEKAVQIARGQLSSICRAVNVLQPRDSSQLHNLPLVVRVDVREHDGKKYNDIKAFYPREGSSQAASPAPAAAGPKDETKKMSAPAVAGPAPWKRTGT